MVKQKNVIKEENTDENVTPNDNKIKVQEKFNEILKDISISDKVKEVLNIVDTKNPEEKNNISEIIKEPLLDLLEESRKENDNKWLENELERATSELEKKENELNKLKNDYKKLFDSKINNSSNSIVTDEMVNELKAYFIDLELTMLGKNPRYPNQIYKDVPIRFLLKRLVEIFPFLMDGRR